MRKSENSEMLFFSARELLKISFQKEFVESDFHRLDNIIMDTLTAIALQSDQHYSEVKLAIENFINEYSSIIDRVHFLNSFLERLEQRYYIFKSVKLDINDVIKKLKKSIKLVEVKTTIKDNLGVN